MCLRFNPRESCLFLKNATSKKLYFWLGGSIVAERDGMVTGFPLLKQYFGQGEVRGATKLYYTFDHLGSIRELVDSAGTVQAEYSYSTYGERTKVSGNLDSDWGYAGLWHHQASGLDLATYRAYDAANKRWISRDPLGEGVDLNLYRYCGNDPIGSKDPSGLIVVILDKRIQDAVDYLRAHSKRFRKDYDKLDCDRTRTFVLELGDLRYGYYPDFERGVGHIKPLNLPGLTKIYETNFENRNGRPVLADGIYHIVIDPNQLGKGNFKNTTVKDVVAHEVGGHAIAGFENGPILLNNESNARASERAIIQEAGLQYHNSPP